MYCFVLLFDFLSCRQKLIILFTDHNVVNIAFFPVFMGHASVQLGYNFVCHQRAVSHTLGGQIDSRKEFYESDLKDCKILLESPPGTQIDFRFKEIDIIASTLMPKISIMPHNIFF